MSFASEPVVDGVFDDEDIPADLTLTAMIRDTLGPPEPTRGDLEKMLARADAWRDSPTTPERLAHINQLAAHFYQDQFAGSWAQPYLTDRFGVDLSGDRNVRPGYAPAGWTTLVHHLHTLGVTDMEMLTAGLATTASTGRLIDRFRDRAVFPIIHDDVVLGFVGRRHPDRTDTDTAGPKYLNTADTPLFHKGDQLFAPERLLATGAIPVIVEGPMDAIAVTLATGGRYAGVAPLGTSLTDEQAAQLVAWGRQPVVATDADLPGRAAAERDYWILTPHGHDPLFAHLPDGTDPADLLATGRASVLTDALTTAGPLGDVLIDERFAHLPPADAAIEAVRIVAAQPATKWETGVQQIADRLDLPPSVIRYTLKDLADAWNRDPRAAAQTPLANLQNVKARLARDGGGASGEVVTTNRVPHQAHDRTPATPVALQPRPGLDR